MKIIVDANVLLRAFVEDEPSEAEAARDLLTSAESIVVPIVAICETLWVLRRVYRQSKAQLAQTVVRLLQTEKIILDRPVVEAGLGFLEAGGDFADGVIAFEGRRLGGEAFVTFDRQAAKIMRGTKQDCVLLGRQG